MNKSLRERMAALEAEQLQREVVKQVSVTSKPGQIVLTGGNKGEVLFLCPDNGRGPKTGEAAQNG